MAPNPGTPNWLIIAQQVSVEMDSKKLCALVNQLCTALDEEAKGNKPTTPTSFASQVADQENNTTEARS